MSRGKLTLRQIEDLFITKFNEKYKLTERDIIRAFSRFDTDGSGNLDVTELSIAINMFLNGVEPEDVIKLVENYDIDGDGTISIKEFSKFLSSRSNENPKKWITIDHLQSNKKLRNNQKSNQTSLDFDNSPSLRATAESNVLSKEDIAAQSRALLANLRAAILKRGAEIERKMIKSNTSLLPNRLSQHASGQTENLAKAVIRQSFVAFSGTQNKERVIDVITVNRSVFTRILQSYLRNEVATDMPKEVIDNIFASCSDTPLYRTDERTAHPDKLVDLLFDRVALRTDIKRPTVSKGPIQNLTDPTAIQLSDVPLRFVTRRCRTALATPLDLDSSVLRRSNRLPEYRCVREHVFGLSVSLHSGSALHALSGDKCVGVGAPVLVFAAAALGVVQDVATGSQLYLEEHDDDVSCITTSPGGGFIATGQVGKRAHVCVWAVSVLSLDAKYDAAINDSGNCNGNGSLVCRLGEGCFERGVCAIAFSWDDRLLCAVGCNDHHTMFIWEIPTQSLLATSSCASGVPPQIRALRWADRPLRAGFIGSSFNSSCDVLVSAGERHLRFWAFLRPQGSKQALLDYRQYRMGKVGVEAPKTFYCAEICQQAGDNDISGDKIVCYTGGSDGCVHVWVDGICVRVVSVLNGNVRCLLVSGDDLVIGGGGGRLTVLALPTLEESFSACVLPSKAAVQEGTGAVITGKGGSVTPRRVSSQGGGGVGRDQLTGPTRRSNSVTRGGTGWEKGSGRGRGRPSSAAGTGRGRGRGRGKSGNQDGDEAAEPQLQSAQAAGAVLGRSRPDTIPVRKATQRPQSATTWVTPSEACKLPPLPVGSPGGSDIIGLTVFQTEQSQQRNTRDRSVEKYVIVATSFGKAFKINLSGSTSNNSQLDVKFHFHYGPVWAVAVGKDSLDGYVVSGGDDRWLCVWDSGSKDLLVRAKTEAPIRCLDLSSELNVVCCGCVSGYLAMYQLIPGESLRTAAFGNETTSSPHNMKKLLSRRDRTRDIADVKFSPDSKMLAVGSHDTLIDIYAVKLVDNDGQSIRPGALKNQLQPLRRLRGHSSYITHLDWSTDGTIIQSTCGAYELLTWNVSSGSLLPFPKDKHVSWASQTCTLGFPVMGIWPKDSDGTDVNAIDVDSDGQLVVTGDDLGKLSLFNYPCVVQNAPRLVMGGHSSHVVGVKVWRREGRVLVVTVGGNDATVMLWRLVRGSTTSRGRGSGGGSGGGGR